MIKFVQCRSCFGKNGKVAEPGYISKIVPGTDGITNIEIHEECECHIKWRKAVELEAKAKRAGLNPKWINFKESEYVGTKSISNFKRLQTYTETFIKPENDEIKTAIEASNIYIYGPNGTQKTTVANWVGYEMLRNGKSVKYILMNDLIKMLQKAERDEELQEKIEKILNVDCLIIDEAFMKERVTIYGSGYQLAFVDSFLRNRIQGKNKGIIFISNVSLDEIDENRFGQGIKDLVSRNVKLSNGELLFEDNFIANKSSIDIASLF